MSFAYFPLYTGDYARDTKHLTPEEHGVYLLLLMHCWDSRGPVPLDERRQCGIVNARSGGEVESVRRVLAEFFVRMDDGWYNRRVQAEIERSESISHARSEAGKRGYVSRSKQLPSNCQAIAKQVLNKSQASASIPIPISISISKQEKRVEARASRFALDTLPEDWRLFCETERSDLDPDEVWNRFSDYWRAVPGAKGRKLDWLATWRNWVRNESARSRGGKKVDITKLVAELEAQGK